MFFEKLGEQHRVHRVVADRVWLALLTPLVQVRVHFLHLFGYETELRDASRVKLVLIAEDHRLECKDRFARVVHGLDFLLKASRRGDRPEMASGIDPHRGTRSERRPKNPSNISIRLRATHAEPDCVYLTCDTSVADLDIIAARRKVEARIVAQCHIE